MNDPQTSHQDPICGMTVNNLTAFHIERSGQISYFCSDECKQKFIVLPFDEKSEVKNAGNVA